MAEATKTYINGYCKEVSTQFGQIINFSINPDDLLKLPRDDRWFVKMTMMKRREPWKYGDTHYMILNTYKKEEGSSNSSSSSSSQDDDLPF